MQGAGICCHLLSSCCSAQTVHGCSGALTLLCRLLVRACWRGQAARRCEGLVVGAQAAAEALEVAEGRQAQRALPAHGALPCVLLALPLLRMHSLQCSGLQQQLWKLVQVAVSR